MRIPQTTRIINMGIAIVLGLLVVAFIVLAFVFEEYLPFWFVANVLYLVLAIKYDKRTMYDNRGMEVPFTYKNAMLGMRAEWEEQRG